MSVLFQLHFILYNSIQGASGGEKVQNIEALWCLSDARSQVSQFITNFSLFLNFAPEQVVKKCKTAKHCGAYQACALESKGDGKTGVCIGVSGKDVTALQLPLDTGLVSLTGVHADFDSRHFFYL
jgi:hypothetical protein